MKCSFKLLPSSEKPEWIQVNKGPKRLNEEYAEKAKEAGFSLGIHKYKDSSGTAVGLLAPYSKKALELAQFLSTNADKVLIDGKRKTQKIWFCS